MKRIIIILSLIFVVIELFAITEFACLFTIINPSARGVAFGNNGGAADVWDISPLGVWSNPAKLGYHNGFALGYSHAPFLEEVFPDIYIRSSYITLGWKGIGVLLPAPSAKKKWGTVFSYGEHEITDENGNVIGTFESWDADTKYAIGMNTIEFMSNFFLKDFLNQVNQFAEISVGYSYDEIYSDLAPAGIGIIEQDVNGIAESEFSSYGYLARLSPFNKLNALGGFCTLDLIAGINYINSDKAKITYMNESQADFLPWGTHSAFSGKVSITNDILSSLELHPIIDDFVDNLFSFYYSQDRTIYGDKSDDHIEEWGKGYEVTFFDVFSLREGFYKDQGGKILGDTFGYGINLNYKDLFQFQYNYAEMPGGELHEKNTKWDVMIRADLFAFYHLMK